jgi:hypothetical protein
MSEEKRDWTDPNPWDEDSTEWVNEHWDEVYKRDRGVISDADRQFLAGVANLGSSASRSNTRRRIRERVRDAILDAEYLLQLDEKQLRKIFESFDDPVRFDYRVGQWLAFLFELTGGDVNRFEPRIEGALKSADVLEPDAPSEGIGWEYEVGDVDVSIDVEHTRDLDDLEEQFRGGEDANLTPTQIGMLVRSGRLDADDLEQIRRVAREEEPRHMQELREQGHVD